MPPNMIACPHCGTENSAKKQTCYHCQGKLAEEAAVVPAAPVAVPVPRAKPAPRSAPARNSTSAAAGLLGVPLRLRAQIYRQLHSLFKAGIPVGLSLNYLREGAPRYLHPMIDDLAQHTQNGGLLSDGMARYYAVFPEWEVSLVSAAEKGGTLPEAMRDIADALEAEMNMRSQLGVRMMPIYATGFVFVLTIMIVIGVQASGGGMANTLNALAQILIKFALLVVAFILLRNAVKIWGRSVRGARVTQAVMYRAPLFGPILRNTMRLRFARVLGALWRAGVPPIDSLQSAARASGNPHLIHGVESRLKALGEGAAMSDILAELRVFPPEALYLVRSGETSGSVGEALEKVAEYIQIDLDAQMKTLPVRLQLIFYIIAGIAVGWLVISFWSQYFDKLLSIGS